MWSSGARPRTCLGRGKNASSSPSHQQSQSGKINLGIIKRAEIQEVLSINGATHRPSKRKWIKFYSSPKTGLFLRLLHKRFDLIRSTSASRFFFAAAK